MRGLLACARWVSDSRRCASTRPAASSGPPGRVRSTTYSAGTPERAEAEIDTLRIHLDYLRAQAALWDARDRADAGAGAEAASNLHVQRMLPRQQEVVLG